METPTARRMLSRRSSSQAMGLAIVPLCDECTSQKAGDDDDDTEPSHHSTDGGGKTEVLAGREGHGQHRRADDTGTSPSIVQSCVCVEDGDRPSSTPSTAPSFE